MNIESLKYDGKEVGYIADGFVYVSPRKQSRHLFRGGAASVEEAKRTGRASWGIDINILELLNLKGIKVVAISDSEAKKLYWAALPSWENGNVLNMKFGIQRFLKLKDLRLASSIDKLVDATKSVFKSK